jgi:hypothetical protein
MAKGRICGDLDNRRGFQIWELKGLFTRLELTQEWCIGQALFKISGASYSNFFVTIHLTVTDVYSS